MRNAHNIRTILRVNTQPVGANPINLKITQLTKSDYSAWVIIKVLLVFLYVVIFVLLLLDGNVLLLLLYDRVPNILITKNDVKLGFEFLNVETGK